MKLATPTHALQTTELCDTTTLSTLLADVGLVKDERKKLMRVIKAQKAYILRLRQMIYGDDIAARIGVVREIEELGLLSKLTDAEKEAGLQE